MLRTPTSINNKIILFFKVLVNYAVSYFFSHRSYYLNSKFKLNNSFHFHLKNFLLGNGWSAYLKIKN